MNENTIEAGNLFLKGRLNDLEKNLASNDYLKYHGNFVNAYGLCKTMYPDLEIFEARYNELMKRRLVYLKTGEKTEKKKIIFSKTIEQYIVEVEILDKGIQGHFIIKKRKKNHKTIYTSFIDLNLEKDKVMDYIKKFKEIDDGISKEKLEELALIMINELYK